MAQGYDRDDDLELASLDFLGNSDTLREQGRKMLDEADGQIRPTAAHEGADRSDSVWVSIDPAGRVAGVEISRHWSERMDPASFPAALFEAYTAGVQKLITSTALAAFAAEQESGGDPFGLGRRTADPDPRPVPPVSEPELDDRDWLAATRSALADLDDQLRRLDRIDIGFAAPDGREKTVTSPQGHLTARIEGRAITGITGDSQRIRAASTEQLRLAAMAMFRAVQAEAGSF